MPQVIKEKQKDVNMQLVGLGNTMISNRICAKSFSDNVSSFSIRVAIFVE